MALVYVALVLTRPVLERVIVLCSARAGERFLGDLRVAAYEKLQELSMPFFEETRAGVLVSRLTADVQTLTTFTRLVLVEVVGSVLLFVVTIVILVTLSPLLSLVMLVSVPLLVVVVAALREAVAARVPGAPRPRGRHDVVAAGRPHRRARRAVVRARESDRYASYRLRSSAQVSAWRRISLVNMGFFPMIAFAQSLALAAVLVVGGYLQRHGRVSVGTIVAFALYLISLFDPIARLGDWFSEFQSGRAALSKIVDAARDARDGRRRVDAASGRGRASRRRRHVRLRREPPAVVGVTLAIAPGEHLALVGATGAGKSTLAKLLVRAYDPGEGHVSFGGVDLREAPLDELRRRIVFVPQEGHLFSGTIADNVRPRAARRDRRRGARSAARDRRARPLRGAARGARNGRALARRPALLGRAAARLDRARCARRSGGDRARRGDLVARPTDGGGRRAGARGDLARGAR